MEWAARPFCSLVESFPQGIYPLLEESPAFRGAQCRLMAAPLSGRKFDYIIINVQFLYTYFPVFYSYYSKLPRQRYSKCRNNRAVKKPISPQPGNVHSQAKSISRAVCQWTWLSGLAAPTPRIAAVLVCVVLTGTPKTVGSSRQSEAARSVAKPCRGESRTRPYPILRMICLLYTSPSPRDRG